MKKLTKKPYVFLKRYLNQPCFENHNTETKLTYLNLNGFSSHKDDISTDLNLLESDIIVIAETKSMAGCGSFKIPGFYCKFVLKAVTNQSGGMALLCKKENKLDIQIIENKHIGFESCYIEYMKITVNNKIYSFVYLHPIAATKGKEWLKEQIDVFLDSSGICLLTL
jgi:hypothetical protein